MATGQGPFERPLGEGVGLLDCGVRMRPVWAWLRKRLNCNGHSRLKGLPLSWPARSRMMGLIDV